MSRIEEIKERFNQFDFVHSYIDDNCCNQEWNEAHEAMEYLLQRLERYEKALKECKEHCSHRDWIIDIVEEALKEE